MRCGVCVVGLWRVLFPLRWSEPGRSTLPGSLMGRPFGKRALAVVAELGDNEAAGPRTRRKKALTLRHAYSD